MAEEKNEIKITPEKESKKSGKRIRNSVRKGGFSIGIILAVLICVVLINTVAGILPAQYTKFDLTSTDVFTLTDTTLDVIDQMEDEVTLYTIASPGNENDYMSTYVALYDGLSDKIDSETIDPDVDFNFLEEYSLNVYEGSVLVVGTRWVCSECGYEMISKTEPEECGECHSEDADFSRKHRLVDISDVFLNSEDSNGNEYTSSVDIEGQLTTAIAYVSSAYIQKVYYVMGHDEVSDFAPSTDFANEVMKLNLDFDYWDMTDTDELPEECDVLIINGPEKDFNDEETGNILTYLENGGAALIFTRVNFSGDDAEEMPNFEKILAAYGVEPAGKVVMESNSNYYDSYYYYLLPTIRNHDITYDMRMDEETVLMASADALYVLEEVEEKENISIVPIITSSSTAYLKKVGDESVAKTSDDESGTFNLGLVVSNPTENGDDETRLAVFSSIYLTSDTYDEYSDGGNYDLLVSTISWLAKQEDNISVDQKSLYTTSLVLESSEIYSTAVLVVLILPFGILIGGFIVWQKRRLK